MATSEETKDQQLEAATAVRPEWGDLVRAYYRHVAPEDVSERSPEDLFGAVASHRELASSRPQGTVAVRVVTPTMADSGWPPRDARWSRSSPTTCPSSSTR